MIAHGQAASTALCQDDRVAGPRDGLRPVDAERAAGMERRETSRRRARGGWDLRKTRLAFSHSAKAPARYE